MLYFLYFPPLSTLFVIAWPGTAVPCYPPKYNLAVSLTNRHIADLQKGPRWLAGCIVTDSYLIILHDHTRAVPGRPERSLKGFKSLEICPVFWFKFDSNLLRGFIYCIQRKQILYFSLRRPS